MIKFLIINALASLFFLPSASSHDIGSLQQWGPYSKEYYGISHIEDLDSGIMVEFCLIPGQYRRNCKVPCTLYETDVHPWRVTADMKHICYRQEVEWKDRVYVDATYHIVDGNRVLLEAHCVNTTTLAQNINLQLAARKSGGEQGKWVPEVSQADDSYILTYPELDECYGVAWDYPMSEIRQFLGARLEQVMPYKAHDHVKRVITGDEQGHYTVNFLRPITLGPQRDTTLWQLIVCGTRDYVEDQIDLFHKNGMAELASEMQSGMRGAKSGNEFLPQAGGYVLGENLLEATLLTNVVYPIDAYGQNIRHFCPGKNWNSLYTWDCGFIGWAMSELDPGRGYEIIRQYTTSPEEKEAFVHHGTPLATQILAIGDVLKNNGSDEEMLKEIYPRLKRFYGEMTGPKYRMASGLLRTWDLFYNSGGWDDYCPQWYIRNHKELRPYVTSVVVTAYYLRCAKILRLMAGHLGLSKDVKAYDADIRLMGESLQKYSWDEEAGYFSYVVHDDAGRAKEIFRTGDGANFNMGLDGVSPLVAGVVTPSQAETLLGHLFTAGELWSDCGITAVSQRAPYYRIDGYWNGTVWMPHQMILWKTMLDLNLPDRAWQIASTALGKWEQECRDSYNCYEHFMIESGRGGGWFNFSGLSSPMINWFCAYFKPGTVSTGFNTLLTDAGWTESKTGFNAVLEFDKDSRGGKCAILACMAPGHSYKVFLNGKEVETDSPYDGMLQFSVQATKKAATLSIVASE